MKTATVDIVYISDAFREQAEQLIEQWRCLPGTEVDSDPARLSESMQDLCRALRRFESPIKDPAAETAPAGEIEALGNYGLDLLVEMSELAATIGMQECSRELEGLCLPMAAWIARQGGEIVRLPPVVNTLARHANQTTDPNRMRELYNLTTEIFEAVSPHVIDVNPEDPGHPWRLLVINRAIIATRTLEPSLMEPALKAIVDHLPEDAAKFFEEGMRQMAKVDYPERVRETMRRYHDLLHSTRTLH